MPDALTIRPDALTIRPDPLTIRMAVHDLIAAYADCIDEDRLEEWPNLFTDPCKYLVISRANHAAGLRQGIMYCATRGMLLDRVMTLRGANLFEPHHYRHLVGPIQVRSAADGIATVHANFMVVRIMHDGVTTLFATGRYLDQIEISGEPYRFRERIVVLDSEKIDTLLAIPL